MEAQLLTGRPKVTGLLSRRIDLIVVHCSATPSGKPLKQGDKDCAAVIDSWHALRGFRRGSAGLMAFNPGLRHIGYHYVIDLDGRILAGRHPDEVPAQAAGFNANAIGVCLVGGTEREAKYTPAQWASLTRLVQWLLSTYALPASLPTRVDDASADVGYRMQGGICGHRDLSPDTNNNGRIETHEWVKTCPGFDVGAWLKNRMQPMPQHVCEAAS